MLKTHLESSNSKVKRLEIENDQLKQTVNLTLYKLDSLKQYGCRENLEFTMFKKIRKPLTMERK